jgi:hypothetical protein
MISVGSITGLLIPSILTRDPVYLDIPVPLEKLNAFLKMHILVEKTMKKAFLLLCLIAVCMGFGKALHWAKKGFSIRRIAAPLHTDLEIWNKEANLAIKQPFRYLGRGRQCFAFESFDGQYVLKFPRTDIYQIPFWMRTLPFFSKQREALYSSRLAREKFVLDSMRISYEELREDTGVLALHFGESPFHGHRIALIDSLGFTHHLPAHKAGFVLQAKKPILMRAFLDALRLGETAKAQRILDAFIDVVVARGKKGIWNKDESFLRNYGFDGIKGYQIDIGSFYHKADGIASIQDTMHPVRTWLAKTNPAMLAYFDKKLESKIPPLRQNESMSSIEP